MRTSLLAVAALATLTTAACKDKGKDGAPAAKTEGGAATKAAPAAKAALELPDFGLLIDAGKDAQVMDMTVGDTKTLMVQGEGLVVTVATVPADATFELAIEDAKMFSPTLNRQDKTADGWVLEYQNKGSMGDNFFVEIVRTVGGKRYKCSATTPNKAQAEAGAAACQTLRTK
jgi:hypothetical protein